MGKRIWIIVNEDQLKEIDKIKERDRRSRTFVATEFFNNGYKQSYKINSKIEKK